MYQFKSERRSARKKNRRYPRHGGSLIHIMNAWRNRKKD